MVKRLPVVLLHGWAMRPTVWAGVRARLSADTPVYAPALPGHGGSPAVGASLAAWSDALLATLPPLAVYCGWSLGGMLALDIAARSPERVAGLLLVGTTPRFVADPDWPHGLAADTVAGFRAGYAEAPEATLRRFLALQLLGDPARKRLQQPLADALDPAAAQGAVGSGSGFADGLRLLAESDLRPAARDIRCPVRLLHGAADALMPAGASRWLASELPAAGLHLLEQAGHAVPLSHAEACATLLDDFRAA